MVDYGGTVLGTNQTITVSPAEGLSAISRGAIRAGEPGFGQGPIYSFDGGHGVGYISYSWGAVPAPVQPAAVAASTGVNPVETSYTLYGNTIPLSVFGVGRIGGDIISGPWVANGMASFIISFGFPADPHGTRDLREIAFDSEVVWDVANGFYTEAFTVRWYSGTLTQGADPLETSHFGADAVAYRPQMLLAFDNLPLANTKFQKIPYVAALIGDATGDDVLYSEAWERLAYSPWVGYTSAQFETQGLTDSLPNGGMIFAQQADFLQTLQQFGRFYPTWDILQTDKLRIVDRSDVVADITLTKERLTGTFTVTRAGQDSVRNDLQLSTIDNGADYTIVPSTAMRPREPVDVTTSVGQDTAYLPIITDAFTRTAVVTFARYHEEQALKTITGTAMAYGLEIEPGALIAIKLGTADFNDEVYKVVETLHGANYTVQFTAAAILKCDIGDPLTDPFFGQVVLLLGFEDGPDGSVSVTDESPIHAGTATRYGSAQIDTAQFKFGQSSGYFPTGNTFPGDADAFIWTGRDPWALGPVWTIEFFVRFSSTITEQNLITTWTGVGAGSEHTWAVKTQPSSALQFFIYDGTAFVEVINLPAGSYTTGVWYYHAICSNGTKIRWFVNGALVGSDTPTSTLLGNRAAPISIGSNGLVSGPLTGWMEEVRITSGICRYDTDGSIAVPTAAFPRF